MPEPEHCNASILIVDDQQSNVRLLQHILRRAGYECVQATMNSAEVAELHAANSFALVILDLQMPGMDGFAVMKMFQQLEPALRPAILVMTADPSQMVPSLEAGASGFMSKPFVLADVVECVGRFLTQHLASKERNGMGGRTDQTLR